MIKVAFFGEAGSGKDWVAKSLRHLYEVRTGKSTLRLAFADKLKDCLGDLMGLDSSMREDFLYSEDFKQKRFIDFDRLKLHTYEETDKFNILSAEEMKSQGGPKSGDGMQIRELCVYYGTMVMQEMFGKDVWVNVVFNSSLYNSNRYDLVTITDVRFPQEYKKCKEEGFTMVRVVMNEKEKLIQNENIAESYLADFKEDYTLNNSLNHKKFNEEIEKLLCYLVQI